MSTDLEPRSPREELIAQRRRASAAIARGIRKDRQRLRREVKDGQLHAFELIRGQSGEAWAERAVRGMRLDRLLVLIPGVGDRTCHDTLQALSLMPWDTFGGMTWAQRAELADVLDRVMRGEPVRIPTPWDP